LAVPGGGSQRSKMSLLSFTALSSFLRWRSRFKICRRCRSRIRRGRRFATSVVRSNRISASRPADQPNGCPSFFSCTWWGGSWGVAEFSSLRRKRSKATR
jgi:hypothetical protein